jgi:hypothetical protein
VSETTLKAIADTILPGDEVGLPKGSDISGVIDALRAHAGFLQPLLPADFPAREMKSRAAILRDVEQKAFQPFRDMVLAGLKAYYEDERVLTAIGSDPAPPQPQGMKLAPMADDLKPALEKVRTRGAIWRRTT